ncbi:LicD family protein [Curtanaerobium respiraculi]|uniref:LicD family protein n=1 Tax=Curtanaerobium respiraculi TaxID=2949669 RepID=UPI0024B39E9F|nr:LicD family protein [Curtanaerobium respiraculi]
MGDNPYPNSTLQRLQDVEREILAIIDKICRRNDIDYFIDGGTCLGAVRHGGFIPWDDDIDIGMPYSDYMRFCEIAPLLLPEGYSLHTSTNTKGFSALWVKVFKDGTRFIDDNAQEAGCNQGIFVDVFAYCQLNANENIAKKQCARARKAQVKSYLKHFSRPKLPKGTPARHLVSFACKLIHASVAKLWSQDELQRAFDRSFDSNNPGKRWIEAAYPDWGSHDAETLFPTQDIRFDELTVRAPHNCDAYLSTLYGDWRQVPPSDGRYTHAPVILDFGDGANVMDVR